VETLEDASGAPLGKVFFFREISHEPLQRRFDDALGEILAADDGLRGVLESTRERLGGLAGEVEAAVRSPGMQQLAARISRARTAIENWLDVDDALAREDFPDAQVLQDRLRVAMTRWPRGDELPAQVRDLARRVEDYYESGENPKQRVL
jgi:hypothetical protein